MLLFLDRGHEPDTRLRAAQRAVEMAFPTVASARYPCTGPTM